MMNKFIFLLIAIWLTPACKPEIPVLEAFPPQFCGCTSMDVTYQVTGALSGTLTVSPGEPSISAIQLDERTTTRIEICATTTVTLTAINGNGESSRSTICTLVDPPIPVNMEMIPCIGGGGVWNALTNPLNQPTRNSEIVTVEFNPDREGVLSFRGISVPVRPGPNMLTNFSGQSINDVFEFRATLLITESCTSGSTGPDGRVRPPTYNIRFNMRCRP